jgi:hypothetical protein
MATQINALNIDLDTKGVLLEIQRDLATLRAKVNNIVTDIASVNTLGDALAAKLNADATVTDTDYAGVLATPATSGAVPALETQP